MATTKKLLLGLFALTLFGCGGSSLSSAKNPFGEIPNLLAKLQTEVPSLKGMKNKDITRELTKEILDKTKEIMTQVEAAAPAIVGNKVPFSGTPSSLVEVVDCVICSAERNLNECRVEVEVLYKVKSGLTPDTQDSTPGQLYATFVDHSDNLLHYAKFRTSISGQADKNTTLFLQLPRIDLTDFKEIRFVTEADLQSMIANPK